MDLVSIYECFCDRTRLRILNLLTEGPLCVCHFQTILDEPQVKVSKHLSYLKARGLVEVKQQGNWRIYNVAATRSSALEKNLACLQDCAQEDRVYRNDLQKLKKLRDKLDDDSPLCCEAESSATRRV